MATTPAPYRSEIRVQIPPSPFKYFSTAELSAAVQLVQLSENSAESTTAEDACSFSAPTTPMSVYAWPPSLSITEYEEDDEDDMGLRRRKLRYRLVDELYEATTRTNREKKKKKGGGKRSSVRCA